MVKAYSIGEPTTAKGNQKSYKEEKNEKEESGSCCHDGIIPWPNGVRSYKRR